MRQGKHINVHSGKPFWPLDARQDEINPVDIAHGLSMLCRANGHYQHFYSVAQHSLFCAQEAAARGLSQRIQLACLLHDASEAYIGDLIRPLKAIVSQYLDIETKLQQTIFDAFGIGDLTAEELTKVTEIDDAMLRYEMAQLLNDHSFSGQPLTHAYDLSFRMMDEVKSLFLTQLQQLLPSR